MNVPSPTPDDSSGKSFKPEPQHSAISKTSGDNSAAGPLLDLETKVPIASPPEVDQELPALPERVKKLLIGKPRDLSDKSVFHHVSLIAFFAWVGLGADGLSSSCYGPAEAFQQLGEHHRYLAVFLAMAIIGTVLIISACYSHIIEAFPSGGGGYLVASKLLGPRVGVMSGCALLVDYILTVTVSIAAAGDALFGLLPKDFTVWGFSPQAVKMAVEIGAILLLIILNLRGVKESVTVLMPIFLLFLVTHFLVIAGSLAVHVNAVGDVAVEVTQGVRTGLADPAFGFGAMLALFLRAYSLGGGTYTGIEAVSNSMPVMREPRVQTAQRTMRYMAFSLAFTAGGLMIAYLLLGVQSDDPTKTLNQVVTETLMRDLGIKSAWLAGGFVMLTMICEGALLFVAAQAGFIDGPRVLANMAHDSWAPHSFASLSERLATHNGILLMGGSALAALLYTQGEVTTLITMYSINVFLTFSLSMIGMCKHWWQERKSNPLWRRRLPLFACGATMCVFILGVTVAEKFLEGGWITLLVTGTFVGASFAINRYYRQVSRRLRKLNEMLGEIEAEGQPTDALLDPSAPTAVILVGGYSGLGIHTFLNSVRFAPHHFRNFVFVSVGVVDSGNFKGADAVDDLRHTTEDSLAKYVDLSRRLGLAAESYLAIGTDPVEELERLCKEIKRKYSKAIVFAGQLVFQRDTWYQRLLHNQTAYSLQRRLQWDDVPMVILPTRVR